MFAWASTERDSIYRIRTAKPLIVSIGDSVSLSLFLALQHEDTLQVPSWHRVEVRVIASQILILIEYILKIIFKINYKFLFKK